MHHGDRTRRHNLLSPNLWDRGTLRARTHRIHDSRAPAVKLAELESGDPCLKIRYSWLQPAGVGCDKGSYFLSASDPWNPYSIPNPCCVLVYSQSRGLGHDDFHYIFVQKNSLSMRMTEGMCISMTPPSKQVIESELPIMERVQAGSRVACIGGISAVEMEELRKRKYWNGKILETAKQSNAAGW